LVTTRPGIGSTVRDLSPVALAYTAAAPSRVWPAQAGDDARDDVVLTEREAVDSEIAERLNVEPGAPTVHRVRHQSKGKGLAQIHEQWIPEPFVVAIHSATGDDLLDKDKQQSTDLFKLLKSAGRNPTETTEIITSRMPTPDERDTLNLPPGVPVLITNRTTRTDDGTPVETSIFVAAADRTSLAFTVSLKDR
jgi:GntR family transcriptional regulator